MPSAGPLELQRHSGDALLAHETIVVVALDRDMNVLWANPAAIGLSDGYLDPAAGASRPSIFGLIHEDDLDIAASAMATVDNRTDDGRRAPTKNASVVVRVRGSQGWVHLQVQGVWTETTDGQPMLVIMARDVSTTQTVMEALRMVAGAEPLPVVMDQLLRSFTAQLGPVELAVFGPRPGHAILYASPDAGVSGHVEPRRDGTEGTVAMLDTANPGWWCCAMPFSTGSDASGTVVVEGHGLTPTPEWVHAITAPLVDLVSVAVSQVRALDELERRATTDPLTGLLNRTGLEAALAASRGQRRSLMCLDLDGFKDVNDEHGHLVGDELLIAVAQRIRANVRRDDTIARYGGDEFIILAVDTDRAAVAALAERLVRQLAQPFEVAGQTLRIGASIGCSFSEPTDGDASLIRRADALLYRAKDLGGHRVESDPVVPGASVTDPAGR